MRSEKIAAVMVVALAVIWAGIHFLRPNATITLTNQVSSDWLLAFHPQRMARFVVLVAGRWLLLSKTVLGSTFLSTFLKTCLTLYALATVILAAADYGLKRGGQVVRVALAWTILHLGFVSLALWQQKPELLAGRHLTVRGPLPA